MITVHVNGREVRVPPSMTVGHAILRYDEATYRMLQDGLCYVTDEAGHEVDPEGALFEGMKLFVAEAAN